MFSLGGQLIFFSEEITVKEMFIMQRDWVDAYSALFGGGSS